MDSLTQIVLGAAVGELVLGRKLGNRAMTWGAVAGTIPDLDVISNFWMSPAESLHAHRGISHSIFFAVLFPFLLTWFVRKLYTISPNIKDKWWYRIIALLWRGFILFLVSAIVIGLFWYFNEGAVRYGTVLLLGFLLLAYVYRMISTYRSNDTDASTIQFKEWYWFFFWTIFTHPILDCFTVYGTQLFMPFSDMRVSWDNIAVADPVYTLAMGLPLWFATWLAKDNKWRFALNGIGIALSTLYLTFTFVNKNKVNGVFEESLKHNQIAHSRYMTNPTILNNFLWSGTAEAADSFYTGQYSLNDVDPKFDLIAIPKNHNLLQNVKPDDYDVNTIKWFSKNYYSVVKRKDGRLQINDMRYGLFDFDSINQDSYIFKFVLNQDSSGYYHIDPKSQEPPQIDAKSMVDKLYNRILGRKY